MRIFKNIKKYGFSLVEVMISVGILAVVAAGTFSVVNIAEKTWNWDMGLVELQQKVRPVIDGMLREIRQGMNITLPTADGGTKITFNVPEVSNSISYNLSGDQILRTHAGTTNVLASDISTLCFCWYNDGTGLACRTTCSNVFTVRVVATKTVRAKTLFFNLTESVRKRN